MRRGGSQGFAGLNLHLAESQPRTFDAWRDYLARTRADAVFIIGDLFESMLKRGYGVKDSSALLGAHGGMLDRVDALLFVGPVVYYYAKLVVLA